MRFRKVTFGWEPRGYDVLLDSGELIGWVARAHETSCFWINNQEDRCYYKTRHAAAVGLLRIQQESHQEILVFEENMLANLSRELKAAGAAGRTP